MTLDLNQLSDSDLEHLANGNMDRMSDAGLGLLAGEKPKGKGLKGFLGDVGATSVKAAIGVGEAVVGLGDLATHGRLGKDLHDAIGYDPKATKKYIDDNWMSEEQRGDQEAVSTAFREGFIPGVTEALRRPSTIGYAALESTPAMFAGGLAGRGAKAATELLGKKALSDVAYAAAGDGIYGAGSAAEQIRQETKDGRLSTEQSMLALASGAGTAAFNLAGGRVAKKLGIHDVDTAIVRGGLSETGDVAARSAGKGMLRRTAEGAVSEGILEEAPQSAWEQGAQNLALGRDISDGMGEAVGMGMLTGGAVGGAVNLSRGSKPAISDQTEGATELVGAPEPQEPKLADKQGQGQLDFGSAPGVNDVPVGENAQLDFGPEHATYQPLGMAGKAGVTPTTAAQVANTPVDEQSVQASQQQAAAIAQAQQQQARQQAEQVAQAQAKAKAQETYRADIAQRRAKLQQKLTDVIDFGHMVGIPVVEQTENGQPRINHKLRNHAAELLGATAGLDIQSDAVKNLITDAVNEFDVGNKKAYNATLASFEAMKQPTANSAGQMELAGFEPAGQLGLDGGADQPVANSDAETSQPNPNQLSLPGVEGTQQELDLTGSSAPTPSASNRTKPAAEVVAEIKAKQAKPKPAPEPVTKETVEEAIAAFMAKNGVTKLDPIADDETVDATPKKEVKSHHDATAVADIPDPVTRQMAMDYMGMNHDGTQDGTSDGMTFKEVANKHGVDEGTVRKRLDKHGYKATTKASYYAAVADDSVDTDHSTDSEGYIAEQDSPVSTTAKLHDEHSADDAEPQLAGYEDPDSTGFGDGLSGSLGFGSGGEGDVITGSLRLQNGMHSKVDVFAGNVKSTVLKRTEALAARGKLLTDASARSEAFSEWSDDAVNTAVAGTGKHKVSDKLREAAVVEAGDRLQRNANRRSEGGDASKIVVRERTAREAARAEEAAARQKELDEKYSDANIDRAQGVLNTYPQQALSTAEDWWDGMDGVKPFTHLNAVQRLGFVEMLDSVSESAFSMEEANVLVAMRLGNFFKDHPNATKTGIYSGAVHKAEGAIFSDQETGSPQEGARSPGNRGGQSGGEEVNGASPTFGGLEKVAPLVEHAGAGTDFSEREAGAATGRDRQDNRAGSGDLGYGAGTTTRSSLGRLAGYAERAVAGDEGHSQNARVSAGESGGTGFDGASSASDLGLGAGADGRGPGSATVTGRATTPGSTKVVTKKKRRIATPADLIQGPEGNARFSRADSAITGNTIGAVRAALKSEFKSSLVFDRKVSIVQSVVDLPEEVRSHEDYTPAVQGVAHAGKVYLVADNIARGTEMGVFLHEAGAHLGFDRILSTQDRQWMSDQVRKWADRDDIVGEAAREALRKGGDNPDEVLAYATEELVNRGIGTQGAKVENSWLRSMLAAFDKALQILGLGRNKFEPQHLVDLARGAAHLEVNSEMQDPGADTRYSADDGLTPLQEEVISWKQAVSDWMSGATPRTESPTIFSHTPAVLQALGLPDVPIRAAGAHFIEDSLFNHGVKTSQLAEVVKDITDPAAVFLMPDNSLNILTRQYNSEGQLVVALKPNTYQRGAGFSHLSVSVFGRRPEAFSNFARRGDMVYQGDVTSLPKEVLAGIAESKKRFGQSVRDLSAVLAGKVDTEARTAKIKYRSDAVKLISEGRARFSKVDTQDPTKQTASPTYVAKLAKASAAVAEKSAEFVGGEGGKIAYANTAAIVKKSALALEFLHDLVNKYKGDMPAVKNWYEAMQASSAMRRNLEAEAESIVYAATDPEVNVERTNDFISRSTYEQKWGYDPKIEGTVTKVDTAMAFAFHKLNAKEQALVKAVFAHGDKMMAERRKLIADLGLKGIFNTAASLGGPYAPLKRFGNYVSLFKSQALVDAEKAEDKKLVEELKADPDHYMVARHESKGLADQFVAKHKGDYALATNFERQVNADEGRVMSPVLLNQVMSALKMNGDIPSDAKAAMQKTLQDIWLSEFDEHNARMSGRKRKNRAGFDPDMLKAFLSHSRAEAGFLASMRHGREINDQFYEMQRQAKGNGDHANQDAFNILGAHYADSLTYKETPWQDRAMALTSAMQLATSVGYHVANFTQGAMVTVPVLAGELGSESGAWSHLIKGYGTLKETGMFGDIKLGAVEDTGLRAALQKAADWGLLDTGMDTDLTRFETTKTGIKSLDMTSRVAKVALHKLRFVSRGVETANRVASATAAYNMFKETKRGNGMSAAELETAAQDYAVSILQRTQGDFSRMGAPLILKKIPKVVGQYKKYQFMMGALYVKGFNDSFMSEDQDTRTAGRRMLAFKLTHTAIAAGAFGMPIVGGLVGLVLSACGGDDEPEDIERWARETIGDKDLADLILHGVPSRLGVDMATRLGEDKVFSVIPYGEWDFSSRDGGLKTAGALAGPATAQVLKMFDGVGAMERGDYYKGLEKFMPKGVADAMSAYRIANEGYTLKNGDVMVKPEDVSDFATVTQFLGMPSTEINHLNWLKNQQYEIKQFYKDRTHQLEHDYEAASDDKDVARMVELRDEWKTLQQGKDRMRVWFGDSHNELKRQPLSDLLRYPHSKAKRERSLQRASAIQL